LKLYLIIFFGLTCFVALSQGSKTSVSLSDRSMKSSMKYFDENDPYFLIFFVNAQDAASKIKLFKHQIEKSKSYRKISKDEIVNFIDSIQRIIFRDTSQFCSTSQVSINKLNPSLPISNYIFWVNNRYWYRVGDNAKNTLEFANEFLDAEKIKSLSIVAPLQKATSCMGKPIAYFYLVTKRGFKFNYKVAKLKFKQLKLGSRWVGHN
jgi:hypothetical protein